MKRDECRVSRDKWMEKKKITVFTLCAMLFALCPTVSAQKLGKVHRIGVLSGGFPGPSADIQAFQQGLRDLGYIDGENLIIEHRYAEGKPDRYPDLVSDLVRIKVDVIVANGTGPTTAAKKATSTIPIVMTSSTDPERTGLIASLAQPGGNVTGVTEISGELAGKLLELFKEIIPKLSRLGIVLPTSSRTGVLSGATKVFV